MALTFEQSEVLALPWAKMDVILEARQLWAQKYARHRWYDHVGAGSRCNELQSSALPGSTCAHCIACGGFGLYNAVECFEHDFSAVRIQAERASLTGSKRRLPWRRQDAHPETLIPQKLVTGPWDLEMAKRLCWLVIGGAAMGEPDPEVGR